MAEVKMTTVKKIGVIKQNDKSAIELRVTDVNGVQKFDIRPWYEKDGKEQCGKGIRLSEEEMDTLIDLINGLDN